MREFSKVTRVDESYNRQRLRIARCLAGRGGELAPGSDDKVLLDVAQDEGVVVLLFDALAAAGAESSAAALRPTAMGSIAKELGRLAEARHVLGALSHACVPALVLKGTALAYWRYPKPAQRSRCDFDVLVRDKASAVHAVTALQAIGYEMSGVEMPDACDFEVALQRRAGGGSLHRIDLHWRLLNNAMLAAGWDFDVLWRRSMEIPALMPGARGLGAVDALIHAALHRLTNIPYDQQDRLIWLYDVHLLAQGLDAGQWRDALQACEQKDVAAPLLDAVSASRSAFDTVMPPEVEAALQTMARASHWQLRGALDAGALDRAHLGALLWREKPIWLWRKLVPSPQFMRYRYGAVGVLGLLRAYLGRWWVGVKRAVGRPSTQSR